MSHTSDLSRSVREHANDLTAQAKAAATQEATLRADQAKFTAAEKVQQAANAADAAASEMDSASPQAQAVQQVAAHIEDVAMKLRTADVREVAEKVTDTARRNPLLFIGGAAIAGFAAARFLKARDPQMVAWDINDDPWSPPARHDEADGTAMSEINGGRANG